MNPNNLFIKFIVELFQRLATKSPKFFQIWQWVTGLLAAITELPSVIHFLFAKANRPLPEFFATFENQCIGLIATGAFFMAFLTTASKPAVITTDGVMKKTDEKALPFTATAELKSAIKAGTPVTDSTTDQQANK